MTAHVRYVGFKLMGTKAFPTGKLLQHIVDSGGVYKATILNLQRVILCFKEPDSEFLKGVLLSNTGSKDVVIYDDATETIVVKNLDNNQVKINLFILNPITSSGLYTHYQESNNLIEFAKILSFPYQTLVEAEFREASKLAKNKSDFKKIRSKYYPSGRKCLRLQPIYSNATFEEILNASDGVLDLEIEIDPVTVFPQLGKLSRDKSAIKLTRLSVEFNKESSKLTRALAKTFKDKLNGQNARARISENLRQRMIYQNLNKEFYLEEPFSNIRPFLDSTLKTFGRCPVFDKMIAMVETDAVINQELPEEGSDE